MPSSSKAKGKRASLCLRREAEQQFFHYPRLQSVNNNQKGTKAYSHHVLLALCECGFIDFHYLIIDSLLRGMVCLSSS